ncbi:NADH:flavin oxidoreductase/NADH oxidase family protein [Paraconexibacter algicola]|uniref:NADH:flavin oxidoreductase n=1 Tax=Paraconexibacter algicola TaxID=2133960 RepID=A0A2T4UL41_9ACTN|nr:NADH:flavin oxidoreductase/NADH oxidase family protein [Paraconexibacter algicola]PTL59918.1 NADH:flavin oxidoreductase [Paraconexibacter algicola]
MTDTAHDPASTGSADPLAAPLRLPNGQELANRFAKAAMSEQLGDRRNRPTPALERLYERWGRGGTGLLITGNVMVHRDHLGEPHNVVIDDDRDLAALTRWATAARSGGAKVWAQVNHPGRQALRIAGKHPVGPSPVRPKVPGSVTPRELTGAEIEDVVARFATTSAVLERAGFDGMQVHGAHGYLVSQFLSPLANQRTDDWGGTPEKRMRFLLEVVRAIRAAVSPGFAVGVKLNSADFQRGGFTQEESMAVVEALGAEGIDLLEISGGTYEAPAMVGLEAATSTQQREAYFLDYAEQVRERTAIPLMLTGGFRNVGAMRNALASGAIDVVGIGRPLAVDTDGPAGLLDGSRTSIRAGDKKLGHKQLDGLVDLYWHTRQLHRIGAGRDPDLREPAPVTLAHAIVGNGWRALRRRRGG